MKNLLEKISMWVVIEFDVETTQYCVINDETPWVFWIWDTKQEAIDEYLSCLSDMILINNSKNYEVEAFA